MPKTKYPNINTDYDGIGVYAIRNNRSGKMYIGSSVNVKARIQTHRPNIIAGGINLKMIDDIKGKRDLKQIEIVVLRKFEPGTITGSELLQAEMDCIIQYNTIENGYNTHTPGPSGPNDPNEILYGSRMKETRPHTIRIPKEIAKDLERCVKESGCKSISEYIRRLVDEDLQRREQAHTAPDSLTGTNAQRPGENVAIGHIDSHSAMISPDALTDLLELDIDPEELPFH